MQLWSDFQRWISLKWVQVVVTVVVGFLSYLVGINTKGYIDLSIIYDKVKILFKNIADFIDWSTLAFVIFSSLAISRRIRHSFKSLLTIFSRVSIGGIGEFSTSASNSTHLSGINLNVTTFLREKGIIEKDYLVDKYDIVKKLKEIIQIDLATFLYSKNHTDLHSIPDFRATIHSPDFLFTNSLIQIIDYIPRGSGKDRLKSIRYGAIGLCYRRKCSSYYPKVNQSGRDRLIKRGE